MLSASSVLLPPPHPQEQVDNMEEEELGQLLLDYAATYNNPKYNQDWDVVDSKFPELAKYDKNVLHDYVATYNNPEYGQDTTVVNAKFPELFGVVKKKDESVQQVPEPASLPLDGTDPSLDSPLPTEPSSGSLASAPNQYDFNIDARGFSSLYQFGGLDALDKDLSPYMQLMGDEADIVAEHLQEGLQGSMLHNVYSKVSKDLAGNDALMKEMGIDVPETQTNYGTGLIPGVMGTPTPRPREAVIREREIELNRRFTRVVYDRMGEDLLAAMPEEMKNDPEALKNLEQSMLEDFGAMIDLTGEGQVGNQPLLSFDGFEVIRAGDMVLPMPKFSGYLADRWKAGRLDMINGFAYAMTGFRGGPEIVERREEAEQVRAETLQFVDGMTSGNLGNGAAQLFGNIAEAGPNLSVMLPVGVATGGLGLGPMSTAALIGLENATVATFQESARITENPAWNLYVKDGQSYSYNQALEAVGGDPERLMSEFTVDDNFWGKAGYLSNVAGGSFIADGFSTFTFMRALRQVPMPGLKQGARDLDVWLRYNFANTGLSIGVGGTTGSLVAMKQYMAAKDAIGEEYTWQEVREVGYDMALTGATLGGGLAASGGLLNLAVARDPVGRNGSGLRFTLEENRLLAALSETEDPLMQQNLNDQYGQLLLARNQQMLDDADYYKQMSDTDLEKVYNISLEQNRLYRSMMKAKEGSDEMKAMATRFDELQDQRIDIESVYDAQRPFAEEMVYEQVDGIGQIGILTPKYKGDDPNDPDNVLVRSRPEGSKFVRIEEDIKRSPMYENFVDTFELLRKWQRAVEKQQPGGVEGRRVVEEADIDVRLRLFEPRTAQRLKDAAKLRKDSGLLDKLSEVKMTDELRALLPEGYVKDNVGLFGRYLYALHAKERNLNIRQKNQKVAEELRAKSSLTPREKEILMLTEDRIRANKGSGMSNDDAVAFLEGLPDDVRAKFDEALPAFRAMQQRTRDNYLASGIYSQAQYDASMNTFENYVGLHGLSIDEMLVRSGDDPMLRDDAGYLNAPKGIDVNGKYFFEAEGRSAETVDILGKAVMQEANSIMLSERNRLTQSVVEFVRQYPVDPSITDPYYRLVGPDENLPDTHTLTAYFDGVPQKVYFRDPDVVRQFKRGTGMDANSMYTAFNRFMRQAAQLKKVHTNFSLEFGPKAFARDGQTALLQALSQSSREFGYALYAEDGTPVNSGQLVREMGQLYPQAVRFMAMGDEKLIAKSGNSEMARYAAEYNARGKTGYAHIDELRSVMDQLRRETDPKKRNSIVSKLSILKEPLKWIEAINDVYEQAPRFAAYVAARRQGVSADRAAALAKYVTVDFNRRGNYGAELGGVMYFYNATAQGIDQAAGTMSAPRPRYTPDGDPLEGAARYGPMATVLGGITTWGMTLTMFNEAVSAVDATGRSEYSKIPDYEKKQFQIFMIPGTKEYVTLPKPYGYGQFLDIGLAAGEVMSGIRREEDAGFYIMSSLEHNLTPISGAARQEDPAKEGMIAQQLAAKVVNIPLGSGPLGGFVDFATNKNSFGGNVFYDKEGKARVMSNQSDFQLMNQFYQDWNESLGGGSKYLSGQRNGVTTDLPANLGDYFAQYYMGGLYSTYNRTTEAIKDWRAIRQLPDGQRAERLFDADDLPFVRDFYSDGMKDDVMSQYFQLKQRIKPVGKEMRDPQELMRQLDNPLPDDLQGPMEFRYAAPPAVLKLMEKVDRNAYDLWNLRTMAMDEQRKNPVTFLSSDEELKAYALRQKEIEDKEVLLMANMAVVLNMSFELLPGKKYDK